MLAVAFALLAAGQTAVATIWVVLCLVDLQPLAAAGILKTTQLLAFAWVGSALLRMPAGLILAGWFESDSIAVTALPFVYLASLLLSAAMAAMIISNSSLEAGDRGFVNRTRGA